MIKPTIYIVYTDYVKLTGDLSFYPPESFNLLPLPDKEPLLLFNLSTLFTDDDWIKALKNPVIKMMLARLPRGTNAKQ